MTIKEDISSMLDAIAAGDQAGAYEMMNSVLTDKAEAALENMRVDMAGQMFGQGLDEASIGTVTGTGYGPKGQPGKDKMSGKDATDLGARLAQQWAKKPKKQVSKDVE